MSETSDLIRQLAAEHGLTPEATQLLIGADEAALRAKAAQIASVQGSRVVQSGTVSQPGRAGDASGGNLNSEDQQIADAMKAGRPLQAIDLLRAKASRRQD